MTLFDNNIFILKRKLIDAYSNNKFTNKTISETINNLAITSITIKKDNTTFDIMHILHKRYSGIYLEKVRYCYNCKEY
jgi:hypothetical protein